MLSGKTAQVAENDQGRRQEDQKAQHRPIDRASADGQAEILAERNDQGAGRGQSEPEERDGFGGDELDELLERCGNPGWFGLARSRLSGRDSPPGRKHPHLVHLYRAVGKTHDSHIAFAPLARLAGIDRVAVPTGSDRGAPAGQTQEGSPGRGWNCEETPAAAGTAAPVRLGDRGAENANLGGDRELCKSWDKRTR